MKQKPDSPLEVCCHTCHRDPGQPCQWDRDAEFHRMRVLHFESQKDGYTCLACISMIEERVENA